MNENRIKIAVGAMAGEFIMVLVAFHQYIAQAAYDHRWRTRRAGILKQGDKFPGKLLSAKGKKLDEQDIRTQRGERLAHDLHTQALRVHY